MALSDRISHMVCCTQSPGIQDNEVFTSACRSTPQSVFGGRSSTSSRSEQNEVSLSHSESVRLLCLLVKSVLSPLQARIFHKRAPLSLVLCRSKGVLLSRPYSPVRRSLTKSLRATESCTRFGAVYEISRQDCSFDKNGSIRQ